MSHVLNHSTKNNLISVPNYVLEKYFKAREASLPSKRIIRINGECLNWTYDRLLCCHQHNTGIKSIATLICKINDTYKTLFLLFQQPSYLITNPPQTLLFSYKRIMTYLTQKYNFSFMLHLKSPSNHSDLLLYNQSTFQIMPCYL